MAFDELRFPTYAGYGFAGGPGHNTAIVTMPSDAEERSARTDGNRRRYDASKLVSSAAHAAEIQSFAIARRGGLRGFRWKDFTEFTSATDGTSAHSPTDVQIGVGDGVTTTFQLVKIYSDASNSVTRRIEKPVSGTVRVAKSAVEALTGWTVDTTTGIVTFSVAPALGVIVTAGFEFDVPVRFTADVDAWMKHIVTDYANRSIPSMGVIELRDETPVDDEFFYGGAKSYNPLADDISITPLSGRAITVMPDASGHSIALPDPTTLAGGGAYFFLSNLSAIDTVDVRDNASLLIATIGALSTLTLFIAVDGSGVQYWMAL